jgi:thiol-disulfide isomerase/thioredoxin
MALEQKPYDAAEFKAAQQAGKAIVVHVTAGWCPTCKAQHAAIDTLAKDPAYANVTIYDVDFDKEPSVWKGFGAQQQSTLIGYAGSKETARSVGETSSEALASVLQSTLK